MLLQIGLSPGRIFELSIRSDFNINLFQMTPNKILILFQQCFLSQHLLLEEIPKTKDINYSSHESFKTSPSESPNWPPYLQICSRQICFVVSKVVYLPLTGAGNSRRGGWGSGEGGRQNDQCSGWPAETVGEAGRSETSLRELGGVLRCLSRAWAFQRGKVGPSVEPWLVGPWM